MIRRLGKQAARHDPRTLLLTNYLRPSLPAPPPATDWTAKVRSWPMMRNDRIGDCAIAAPGHMIQEWTTYAGTPVIPSDAAIVAAYSAVSGYDPKTGAHDDGCNMLDVLNYWRRKGIAGRKILGYVALQPGNHEHVRIAIDLFGNALIGLNLPRSAEQQINAGKPWTAPRSRTGPGAPGSWGGHAVPVLAYDPRLLNCVTWGTTQQMAWGFWDGYCDEAYAVISRDWIGKSGQAPSGFDLAALQADLAAL